MTVQDITIIVNTFNSDEKIFSCLNSIDQKIKVLVIENSSRDDFKKKIENKYPNAKCVLTNDNLGYAKGNNLGLKKVKTKYALILNPDALLDESAIKNFFISANKLSDFGIIAPAIQEEKDTFSKDIKELTEVKSVKGFAMFLNLKNFKDIGFFDEKIFIYFEEIDLCKRLREINKKIYLDPSILIKHLGGSSHNESINFEMELSRNWHWMWSSFYYHKKHKGFVLAFLKIIKKLFSAIIKFIFYTLVFNKDKKKIYYQRASGLLNSIMGKESWYRPKVF